MYKGLCMPCILHALLLKGQKEAGSMCEGVSPLYGSVLKDHSSVLPHQ